MTGKELRFYLERIRKKKLDRTYRTLLGTVDILGRLGFYLKGARSFFGIVGTNLEGIWGNLEFKMDLRLVRLLRFWSMTNK